MSKNIPKKYFNMHLTVLRFLGFNIVPIENRILRYIYNIYSFSTIWITYIIFLVFEIQALFNNFDDLEKFSFILGYFLCHFMGKFLGISISNLC